ncbi:hypothetical protein BDF14DRAFT_1810504 [Spinellus fusiger]|nr:hypothetical protein BDF14DRAFT_1810504 [Spinellus fusiger]
MYKQYPPQHAPSPFLAQPQRNWFHTFSFPTCTDRPLDEKPLKNKDKEATLYKTEYCRNWTELGHCRYGKRCCYAHGSNELRAAPRHNRYKTQICRAYHVEGACPYGIRCTFIHDIEVASSPTAPTAPKAHRKHSSTLHTPAGQEKGLTDPSLGHAYTNINIWHSKLGLATQYPMLPMQRTRKDSFASASDDSTTSDDSLVTNTLFSYERNNSMYKEDCMQKNTYTTMRPFVINSYLTSAF